MTQRLLAAGLLALVPVGAAATLSARMPQEGALTRESIALAADRIRHDRWYDALTTPGANQVIRRNATADMDHLLLALKQPIPELRAAAVRELGRFELVQNAPLLASFLGDSFDLVRRQAADALVQTLWDKTISEAALTVELLDYHITLEQNAGTRSAFWNALAELPLEVQTARKYEQRFVDEMRRASPLALAAQSALLTLTQHRRGRPLMAETERQVMEWAGKGLDQGDFEVKVGTVIVGMTYGFLEILQAAQADADDIAIDAAAFFCRRVVPLPIPCGSDIRRLGVELLNSSNPAHVPALLDAARNRADVRAASHAIRNLLKSTAVTRCRLLDLARGLPAETDVIAALADDSDERKGECGDWSAELALAAEAQNLISATKGTDWIAPAAALEALAKRAPGAARPIATEYAAGHSLWQVRVTAARVAGRLNDREMALKLASDQHPNVQAAALEAMRVMDHPALADAARTALSSEDLHVVRTATVVLKGLPGEETLNALFEALRRLSAQHRDTSRRARLALLERIEEFLPGGKADTPSRQQALEGLLRTIDPMVAKAAGELLQKSSGAPVEVRPNWLPAPQPSGATIRTMAPCVMVYLEGEEYLTIVLNRRVAPVAVARFLEAMGKGYYDNSMFYRDDENVTVFGNPAPNDEGGWPRFARDEPGSTVRPMSVAMLKHEPDAIDGRLAIRWLGSPELDRRETVIGQAYASKNALREVGLGKMIEKIAVGGEGRVAPAGPNDPCYPRRPW